MDDDAKRLRVHELSLLIELKNPSLIPAHDYMGDTVWKDALPITAIICRFLDMLALVCVRNPGADQVTAVSLDVSGLLPATLRPGMEIKSSPEKQAATIRIAQNGDVAEETVTFVEDIIRWITVFGRDPRPESERIEELQQAVLRRCLFKILGRIGKFPRGKAKSSTYLHIRNTINTISQDVKPEFIQFNYSLRNFPVDITHEQYTPENHVTINHRILEVLCRYRKSVDNLPATFEEKHYRGLGLVIFAAANLRQNRVCAYIIGSACKLIGEDGVELLGYLGKVGTYYRALKTFHTLATRCFTNRPLFTQFEVEVVPLDSLKGHAVTISSANRFQDLKIQLLRPDQQPLFFGAPAKLLESEYNSRIRKLVLKEHCEMRLLRFYEEERSDCVLAVNHFGISKRSCYCCNFVLKYLQNPKYLNDPEYLNSPATTAEYHTSGTHGKVYAAWAFPQINYSNNANSKRLRSIEASLINTLKSSATDRLTWMLNTFPSTQDSPPEGATGSPPEELNNMFKSSPSSWFDGVAAVLYSEDVWF